MKKQLLIAVALLFSVSAFSQLSHEYSAAFAFDPKSESDPKFVLADNYNHYLLTVVVTDGLMAKRQMILRKFDQKNVVVNTYAYDFPKFDPNTLFNYLGSVESNNRVAVFTQTYSGKAKQSAIVKHEFDKATAQFTSTEILSIPIQSAMKSGTVYFDKSVRGNFIGFNYVLHRAKEEPEINKVVTIDAKTLNVAWIKDFSFADNYVTRYFSIANSGNAVFTRVAKGMKKHNYVVVGNAETQTDFQVGPDMMLQQPTIITIGDQEYLLAFNYRAKGIRRGDFGSLLLFDLASGLAVTNADIGQYASVLNLEDVIIRDVVMKHDSFHIFTEGKVKRPMATTPTVGGFGSGFPADDYRFGPSYLYVLNNDGTIKSTTDLTVDANSKAELFRSFGITNVKGDYYLNTGMFNGFYALDETAKFSKRNSEYVGFRTNTIHDSKYRFINNLSHYFPDTRRIILARVVEDDQMQLVTISGIK